MLPIIGEQTSPEAIRHVTTTAQRLEYDGVCMGDHVMFPGDITDEYPFSRPATRRRRSTRIATSTRRSRRSLTVAATDRIHVGTNVCLAPLRHPVVVAKSALTTGALSGWRFRFGVGLGWLTAEYDILDVPRAERGSRLDEFLTLFERARSEGRLEFDGPHHTFQEVGFKPVPPAGESLLVWIGGLSGAALRRVAEFGDSWRTVGDTSEEVRAARGHLERAWRDYERAGDPAIAVTAPMAVRPDGGDADASLVGPPAEIAKSVGAYQDAGVTHIIFLFRTNDVDEQAAHLERFAADVRPLLD